MKLKLKRLLVGLAYLWDFIRGHSKYGYDCPKCQSQNTETYMHSREQNCLECGYEFPLPLYLKVDMGGSDKYENG